MEWKACREQHPGGMGDGVPHINNMSDQRIQYKKYFFVCLLKVSSRHNKDEKFLR